RRRVRRGLSSGTRALRRHGDQGGGRPARCARLPRARRVMRIALVLAGRYPDLRGSQVLVRHLAEGIGSRGHAVHLVTYGPIASVPPGPRVERVVRDVELFARLWRTVTRAEIDVIHAHNYEAAIASLAVARLT